MALANPVRQFPRGAVPTPRHKLAAAMPHVAVEAPPPQIAYIPSKLDMWGNDQYGDCVSAEEAFAKATYVPEIFIDAKTVEAWAKKHGWLNGADLTSVMDAMAKSGFVIGSQAYNDGPHLSVDYSNETALQSALAIGPVKIGIDASALPHGAGNQQGWSAFGGRPGQFHNEDHCVALCGYGPTAWLAQQLGVQPPSGPANGYLLFTWSTIGIVDHAWIMSTCGEAWVRNPTTVGVPPLPTPTPPIPPVPPPMPVTSGLVVSQPIPAGTYNIAVGNVPVTIALASVLPAGTYVFDPAIPWIFQKR